MPSFTMSSSSLRSVSSISGCTSSFQRLSVTAAPVGRSVLTIESKRTCQLTGAQRNKANTVTFSNKHNRKWQEVNLHQKKVYWPEAQRMVVIKLSTKAMRTVEKNGLQATAKKIGLDLSSLPYTDVSPARTKWLAENKGAVPMRKNRRAMKNPEKLAASKKKPQVAKYQGGRVVYERSE